MSQHQTPGEMLRQAREQRALEQQEVAKQLRLSAQTIIDIERDDYRHFTAEIYLRGHMRAYARLVNVDLDELLKAYEKMDITFESDPRTPAMLANNASITRSATRNGRRKAIFWAGFSVLFILIIMVMLWWQEQRNHTTILIQPIAQNKPVAKVETQEKPLATAVQAKKKTKPVAQKAHQPDKFVPDYSVSAVKNRK